MRYYQVAYRGNTLSISEEDLSFLPRSSDWSQNLYTVEGAVESDIKTLNSLEIKGNDINAVADELTKIWFDLDTAGCVWEEIVDLEEADVVYDPASHTFLAVSDIETEPVYMYWNGHEFKYVWLPEPEHIVEAGEEPDLTIQGENSRTAVYDISALDGKTAENVFYLREWSQAENIQPTGRIISSKELDKLIEWVRNHRRENENE